jgi:hypothetical protein
VIPSLLAAAAALASVPIWWPAWRGVALARRLLVSLAALCAAITAALGGAHLIVVATQIPGNTYDFRAYSLLLLGAVLVLPALVCGAAVPGLVRGDRSARRLGLGAFAALLLVNLPLIPLQGFAILLSVTAAVGIAGVAWLRPG